MNFERLPIVTETEILSDLNCKVKLFCLPFSGRRFRLFGGRAIQGLIERWNATADNEKSATGLHSQGDGGLGFALATAEVLLARSRRERLFATAKTS